MVINESEKYPYFVNILGIRVSATNMELAKHYLDQVIASRSQTYVCVTGVHGVMESQSDTDLRNIHNAAGLVTPDGMPLVWLGRWWGQGQMSRVYGPDLMLALCQHSLTTGYRHFFFGGGLGVAEELSSRLRTQFPGLLIAGVYTPPFRPLTREEEDSLFESIAQSGADIVWVGLSTPKQEKFMASVLGRMPASVMIGVGAAFDFHSGRKQQAPVWMRQSGLEWLFRLITEPRRLWKRYLKNNPSFVLRVLAQSLGLRRYEV